MAMNKIELLERIPINTNIPGLTLASLVGNKAPFYVPLDSDSLCSEFCKGIKWRNIVGAVEDSGKVCEIDGMKLVPIYLNPKVEKDSTISLYCTPVLTPSLKYKLIVPCQKAIGRRYKENSSRIRMDYTKSESFIYNGIEFKLHQNIKELSRKELIDLRGNIVKALKSVIRVDYIVTDTNNWCTKSEEGNDLKYEYVLEQIATYIERKELRTKFLVLSEILTELKRLSNYNIYARKAQRLLNNRFMPRDLIFIPNPEEIIPSNIIADPSIQKEVVKLYKEGKRITVISNDQQAMMLFNANVTNEQTSECILPNFLSLEKIHQLYLLLNKVLKLL